MPPPPTPGPAPGPGPRSSPSSPPPLPPAQPAVCLSDILGSHRSLTTFASLVRLHLPASRLLADDASRYTVLAPRNLALDALPRRPWETSANYDSFGPDAYTGQSGQVRASNNIRAFVDAHLLPVSPWPRGQKARTLDGRELWWEEAESGKRVIMPDKIEVDCVAGRVANGELWILNGVLKNT